MTHSLILHFGCVLSEADWRQVMEAAGQVPHVVGMEAISSGDESLQLTLYPPRDRRALERRSNWLDATQRALLTTLDTVVTELEGPSNDDAWMNVPDDVLAERCRIAERLAAVIAKHRAP